MLRDRTLIGELPLRDGWVDGAHPPLLDEATFEAAQRLADQRSTQSARARAKGEFLLSGTMVRGHCGAAYTGTTGPAPTASRCAITRAPPAVATARPSAPRPACLEELVTDALLSTYADSAVFDEAVTAHLARRESSIGPLTAELAAAQAAVATTERKLARYRDDYEAERIAGDTYLKAKTRLAEDLVKATAVSPDWSPTSPPPV